MEVNERQVHLLDFGMGMLAALHLRKVTAIDERNKVQDLHAAFVAAFRHLKESQISENLRFWMTTHKIYGTTPDVDTIMNHWLGLFATKDSPGTIWRFSMYDEYAERLLTEELPGGRDLWIDCADIFLERFRHPPK